MTSVKEPPRIAILYEPESVPLLKLTALAARSVFSPVWVTQDEDVKILRRFGSVLQVKDQSVDETAARLLDLGASGITTFADNHIERTAAVAERMGLPSNNAVTARCLVDKIAQRQALADAGLPGPAFVGIRSREGVSEEGDLLGNLRYPVVAKPVFGFGGRDTHCLDSATEVRTQLGKRRAAPAWQPTIVEECLGNYPPVDRDGFGDYVSVEVVVADGIPTVIAVTGRMPLAEPFRETGAFLPSTLSPDEQSEVSTVAVRAARALDVRQGCLHIEIKLTAQGPRVIEVNGRVPGGGIAELVSAFTGDDLYELALESALGGQLARKPVDPTGGVHYHFALQPPIGRRVRLQSDWSPRLREIPGLTHVTLRASEADADLRDGSYGYLLMASGVAADHGALLDTYRRLYGLMIEA